MTISSFYFDTGLNLISIWDDTKPSRSAFHGYSEQAFNQGFSWMPGSVTFFTFGRTCRAVVEVCVLQSDEVFHLQPETMRAIRVPFNLVGEGIRYTDCMSVFDEALVPIPPGHYSLVFENRLNDNPEYLSSPAYLADIDAGFSSEIVRLSFVQTSEVVEPAILKMESWSQPPYQIEGYDPLNPAYPLLMKVCLLMPLPFTSGITGPEASVLVTNHAPESNQETSFVQNRSQGYVIRPDGVEFCALGNAQVISVEAWCAGAISLQPGSVRAIVVPFNVADGSGAFLPDGKGGGYELADILTVGSYALLFEIRLNDDLEYLTSPRYQDNTSLGLTEEYCCLTFIPTTQTVVPQILRFAMDESDSNL
jgi:hypothetical protein